MFSEKRFTSLKNCLGKKEPAVRGHKGHANSPVTASYWTPSSHYNWGPNQTKNLYFANDASDQVSSKFSVDFYAQVRLLKDRMWSMLLTEYKVYDWPNYLNLRIWLVEQYEVCNGAQYMVP